MRRTAETEMREQLKELRRKLAPMPQGRYLIGLSGGADSVALLTMLAGESAAPGIAIEAVHVNHGLRGAESDGDEAFVRELCETYHVPLHVFRVDLQGRKDENAAREARFRCFRECMADTEADCLVLAHHADDLAETFMMRLLRGAGPEGLGCMKAADTRDGVRILRPMLKIRRFEIREALRESGIPWREDSSNRNADYLRNDVRMRLIPLMEEMNAGAAGRIAETARQIAMENEALAAEAERFLRNHAGSRWLDPEALKETPEGMRRRILRQWWRNNAPRMEEHELSAEQTERLAALAAADTGKVNLPGGLFAEKGRKALHLTGMPAEPPREVPVTGDRTDFGPITFRIGSGKGNPGDGKREQEVPEGFLQGCVIRTRRPGDRISPFGMTGSRKLQDYLTDRGIDAAWRDEIPLLCRGNEVLLAAGVGAGNIPEWTAQTEHIRLAWEGEMPWNR